MLVISGPGGNSTGGIDQFLRSITHVDRQCVPYSSGLGDTLHVTYLSVVFYLNLEQTES